ncbi:STAS domain-containing protein [Nitrosococcus wardiae]|uniref:Anti-sigma factor antagonist n=1 Tax=Nitrosococcus wardiae TaxID=1814290 RepID=A0A4P7BY86_9GAMM|nr:STAS domain-containing protein [Nitrosococcus wardiae]QBQ54134.1 anti-sigma factor antagonist [Nitrosococcus wardiae]
MIFRIDSIQRGHFRIVGELTFDTVPEATKKGLALFDEVAGELCIDLQGVFRTDSAGLALLITWMRYAQENNKSLQFFNIPAQMLAIARISSLDQILPLAGKQALSHLSSLAQDKKLISPVS